MKKCSSCGIEKEEDKFNWKHKDRAIRQSKCSECHKLTAVLASSIEGAIAA